MKVQAAACGTAPGVTVACDVLDVARIETIIGSIATPEDRTLYVCMFVYQDCMLFFIVLGGTIYNETKRRHLTMSKRYYLLLDDRINSQK